MKLDATLEQRVSKTGNPYEVVVIKITDNIEKLVFLTPSEKELIKVRKDKETKDEDRFSFE